MHIFFLFTVSGQQQNFRVRPQAREVIEGHSVELMCEVSNQAGAVQWSKDGFVLGFNRSIPGYPRYSMTGDPMQGIHNLKIENATLDDDAEYQCQVGPTSDHKAIRADAHVTVLRNLSAATVSHWGGRLNSEGVAETNAAAASANRNPAAPFFPHKEVPVLREKKHGTIHHLLSARITAMRLLQKDYDNPATTALQRTRPSPAQWKTAGRKYVKHSYVVGRRLLCTDRRRLTCSVAISGGNWKHHFWTYCREQPGVLNSYNLSHFDITTLLSALRRRSSSSRATYALINSAHRNRANFLTIATCSPALVAVAPSKVKVRGPKEAKAGDQITMRCSTERSNPPAEVSWVVDGRPFESVSTITADPKGGWVTTSNITVNITGQERNMKMFSCYAVNQALGDTVVETAAVSILYAPDAPRIFGYTEGTPIRAKTLQHITCVTNGGNPLPTLRWFKGTQKVNSTTKTNGNSVSSEVAIIAQDSDNGAVYRCEASNPATKKALSTSIKLTVHFPPTAVTIKIKPRKPKSGQKMTLTCETGSSHPQSSISWWKDGLQLSGGVDDVVVDGPFGGRASKNVLVINVTTDDDRANYMCQATNRALQLSVHDSVSLDVTYKPEFYNAPLERFDIVEGESLVINLTARANPSAVTYSWTKDDRRVPTVRASERSVDRGKVLPSVYAKGSLLNLTNVERSDGGVYECEAENSEGSTKTSILINIQYGAIVKAVTETVIVDAGSHAQLECEVDAKPFDEDTVSWRRQGFDMSRTRQTVKDRRAYLTVQNVSREDSGAFDCVAHNGIGEEAVKTANLIVKFRPEIDRNPPQLKAAGKEGGTAELLCRAQAAPNASFAWSREGAVITSSSRPDKYDVSVTQTDLVTFESTLSVKDIRSSDYGHYECVARNELGFDSAKVHLDTLSAPDPPLQLRVTNATYNSLTLVWRPGFDGGLPQSFRLRYRKAASSEGYHYQDVLLSNMTNYTIGGLSHDTEYTIGIMSFNEYGQGEYLKDIVKGKTTDDAPPALTQEIPPPAKIDIPKVIITSVSVVGTSLLFLNIVLVICFVRKRRKKRLEEEESDQSSKTATIEMYAPSSYNETMNGETVSSTSEKSEAYSNEHSAEYSEESSKPAAATYLIDQGSDTYVPEAPLHYTPYNRYTDEVAPAGNGSIDRRMLSNRRVHYEGDDEYYSDALRRNAYNQKLGDKVRVVGPPHPPPPPGRTAASGVDAIYNIKAEQQRYVPFPMPGGGAGAVSVHHQADPSGQPILSTFSPTSNASLSPVLASLHSYGPPLMDGPVGHDEMDGHLV
ncbi:unnamed protein product [Ixodes hexagonus]